MTLLGQSWGVTLAIKYIAALRPQGPRPHQRRRFVSAVEGGTRRPAHAVAAGLSRHDEVTRARGHNEYQEGLMRFYTKHILNVEVWPQEAIESLMQMTEDPTVYRAMYVRTPFVP